MENSTLAFTAFHGNLGYASASATICHLEVSIIWLRSRPSKGGCRILRAAKEGRKEGGKAGMEARLSAVSCDRTLALAFLQQNKTAS